MLILERFQCTLIFFVLFLFRIKKVGLHERLRQARITKYSACHAFVTVIFTVPHLVLIYVWFQQDQKIKSVPFHSALLWSWVLVGMKLAASAFFFYRLLHYNGDDACYCFETVRQQRITENVQIALKIKTIVVEETTSQQIPIQDIDI